MFSTRCHLLVRNLFTVYGGLPGNGGGFSSIHTSPALWSGNYYEALGIPQTSTQNDIKAAYYKLSMMYHPDKNKGSKSAAKKFQEISQAYEVLGNYRLRRLYDKGIIHTAGPQYARPSEHTVEPEVEDDPETKFYKSRFKKSHVADTTGRTPIYDFDEWSRAHYGKSFERRQNAKARFHRKESEKKSSILIAQNEILLFGMAFILILTYAFFHVESSYDTPKERAIRASNERDQERQQKILSESNQSK